MRASVGSVALVVVLGLLAGGCAAAKRRDLKAKDYWPTKSEWKRSTVLALKDRGTWIPAAGAALMAIDDWDQEISDWAVENTPVFGSVDDAKEASDNLRTVTSFAMVGTALAVPNGSRAWEFKPERLALEIGGLQLNNVLTGSLKGLTGRTRPDGSDDRSFPSGHASQAFTRVTFARLNVNQIESIGRPGKITLKATFTAIAAGTAWARVEGDKHYPSDVMFSAALGNFVARFVHEAFLPEDSDAQIGAYIGPREASFTVTFTF
ncbi:MAG: phosphatase PAP2 family protein [Acidobacteriota bacterium]|nr:phosphatase PAP2 family protein [Acidobacteriota bacterium]